MKDSKLVYHSSVHKWPDGAKAARIDTELLDQTPKEALALATVSTVYWALD